MTTHKAFNLRHASRMPSLLAEHRPVGLGWRGDARKTFLRLTLDYA